MPLIKCGTIQVDGKAGSVHPSPLHHGNDGKKSGTKEKGPEAHGKQIHGVLKPKTPHFVIATERSDDDKRKETPFVIPTERSDEGSPNAANRSMRYLPAVDMTNRVA